MRVFDGDVYCPTCGEPWGERSVEGRKILTGKSRTCPCCRSKDWVSTQPRGAGTTSSLLT